MEKLSKYKKQIFTFVTIFLLLEFGVFPCLTMANTLANIIGAIALVILVLWGGIELYEYVKSDNTKKVTEEIKLEEVTEVEPKPKKKVTPKVKKIKLKQQ